jgi:hypothetical protein
LSPDRQAYVRLDPALYAEILNGKRRL